MPGTLRRSLARHHDSLRRAVVLRHALRGAALAALALAVAVLLGVPRPGGPALAWTRLALFAAGSLAALWGAARATRRAIPAFDEWLEGAEARFPEIRSWLRNALDLEERPPAHTSPELAGALSRETAKRLESVPLASLTPPVEPRRALAGFALAAAALVVCAALAPRPTLSSWRTLWNPAAAAPPVRLVVEPGSVRVTPGSALAVRARVWGTAHAPRLLREGGPALEAVAEGAGEGGERRWRFDLTQLTRDLDYRVRVANVTSPGYRISLAGEPRALSFDVELRAPAYARLPLQRTASTSGDLAALRGSRATVEVTFDRDLTKLEGTLPDGAPARFVALSPRRWRGEVPVTREGAWQLRATAASGAAAFRWRVSPLEDAPPVLAVRTPAGDLDLPAGQSVPLEVIGQDDLGLSSLELEFRKGMTGEWRRAPLSSFPGAPRDAHVTSGWDASVLGLVPGETAAFRFVLWDNNAVSGRGKAVSPAFELRFPSLAELYENVDREHEGVQNTVEKLAEKARELQKSLDKLSRQPPPPARSTPQSQPAFERSEELKTALERQQEMSKQLDQAAQQLQQSVEKAAERKAFDRELMQKLQEMTKLLQEIRSPDLQKALERMKNALEKLDKTAMEKSLPEWQKQNQDLLKNLERTLELLRQLREEEKLAALSQRAEELKKEQDALNEQHADRAEDPSGDRESRESEARERAGKQEEAAKKTEALAEEAKDLAGKMSNPAEKQQLEEAARELEEQAAEEQREAAQQAQDQKNSAAQQSGQKASKSLEQAQQSMSMMMSRRQQAKESADLAAVRRAARDLVSLQREADANLRSPGAPSQRADRQLDAAEGAKRVADSLYTLSEKTPFISPSLAQALGRAIQNLDASGRELANGNRERSEQAGRAGADALNEAVLELRDTEAAMQSQPGNAPGGQKPSLSQQVGELGERQGKVNRDSRRVAQKLTQQMEMSAGDQQEMQRLAEEQRAIRERLEQVQKENEEEQKLLGRLDQAQKEMEQAEESLRSGQADGELEQQQQRILSRLLDAQRSVNRRDFNPQRESRSGEDVARGSPAELPADLLRASDRLRLDLLKVEADRYPAQYRALIERYLRALNGARR